MKLEAGQHSIDGLDRSLAAFAVMMAFFASPILRYIDPNVLVQGGAWAALGFGLQFTVRHFSLGWRLAGAGFTVICLGLAAWWFFPAGSRVLISSQANDRRCLAIQRDMLSSAPKRDDDADVFQALGCRPQGEGSVHAPPAASAGRTPDHAKDGR